MNHSHYALIILATAFVSVVLLAATDGTLVSAIKEKFKAKLSGKTEVPKVNTTAKGTAFFTYKEDLAWKISLAGLSNVTGAELHLGNNFVKGDSVVNLMKLGKITQTPGGLILNGTISKADLEGPMRGKNIADLKTAISNSQTYVDIYTSKHPDGEIRGLVNVLLPKNQTNVTSITKIVNVTDIGIR